MLLQLEIRNFAIIEHSIINFENSFNVITGETGAGKSILLDALSCILGERSSKEFIRKGEERAEVKAVFSKTELVERKLSELGFFVDDDYVILERQITRSGKSFAKLNGSIVSTQVLKDFCEEVIEICGQREHLSLFREDKYLQLIDDLAGDSFLHDISSYREVFSKWKDVCSSLDSLQNTKREQEQLLDYYRFQKDEIEKAHLKIGEDDELESERKILASFEKISRLIYTASSQLDEIELHSSVKALNDASKYDEKLSAIASRLEGLSMEFSDVQAEVSDYRDSMEYDEDRLNEIMSRLDAIKGLKRKYGDSIEMILDHYEKISQQLDEVDNKEFHIARLEKEKKELETTLLSLAERIHQIRQEQAGSQEFLVNEQLRELCMPDAKLSFVIDRLDTFSPTGITKVSILFTANKGEDPKPLHKVASGGEMSRVLLGMKIASSSKQELSTLIFDEVDQGVGGEAGRVIGEKLARLGGYVQTIAISHLPQVAAKGDAHFLIRKSSDEDRTVSRVNKLTHEERVTEIARMIFGDESNETTIKQAGEMLKKNAD